MLRQMKSFAALVKGLIIGWLIGAGIALVYAPRRGDETRAMLRDKGMELKDQAAGKVEETRSRAEEMARTGMERINEIKQQSQATLEEQKVVLQSTVEGLKEGVRTYKEQGQTSEGALDSAEADLPVLREQAVTDFSTETPPPLPPEDEA